MKRWAWKHGCRMRTEVTFRPQRVFAEPWVSWCVVSGKKGWWITKGTHTSKLGAVDVAMNKMYGMLIEDHKWERWDMDPF